MLNTIARERFGVGALFPYQRLVIAHILDAAAGTEAPRRRLVILPTGSGKSLCFQLPALLLSGPTLIVYPILALMADQERRLRERGFSPAVLRGGQSRQEREALWTRLQDKEEKDGKDGKDGKRFIITNPETLLSPGVLERLIPLGISHLVIDEAHCVSEWGESFRPAYRELGRAIKALSSGKSEKIQVTAFTATASAPVLKKIRQSLFEGEEAEEITEIIGNPDRGNIRYAALGCVLPDLAVRDLLQNRPRPAIVFCSSRGGTEKLARYLRGELGERERGEREEIKFYHAGLSREEKAAVEQWFFQSRRGVLAATCAYGMGVDKADVRTVIHRDCPPSVEAYLQESGRAGRDGRGAEAILLWGPGDRRALDRCPDETARQRLQALLDYGRHVSGCRRKTLLSLLGWEGEAEGGGPGCCDLCDGVARGTLREAAAVRAFFRRNPRCYTAEEAACHLGEAHGARWTESDARRVIEHLLREGVLKRASWVWKHRLWAPQAAAYSTSRRIKASTSRPR